MRKTIYFFPAIVSMTLLFNRCNRPVQTKHPNVVLILTDDQGWGDFSCNGNKYAETPVMDSISEMGARFDRFYVSPLCAPTRASLLTGRYHLRTGVSGVTNREEIMRLNETTIAQVFKQAGYKTGCFGKWHNGAQYPYTPNGKGFDEFLGFCAGHWSNYFNTHLEHNGKRIQTKGYISDVLANAAIDFITANKNNRFFCYIPFNAPHSPFQVPDKYFNKYKAKGLNDTLACIYGMVDNLNYNIAKVLSTLDSLKLTNNTIFIFLTDNGPNTWRYNGDMKGIKSWVDEGGVRVPCFIRYPGVIKPNTEIKTHAAHIDILPTLADFCNIPLADTIKPDGISLVKLLTGKQKDNLNRMIFAQNKLRDPSLSVRDNKYILVRDKHGNNQLYGLVNDPGEKNDITQQYPGLVKHYADTLINWYADVTQAGLEVQPVYLGLNYNLPVELQAPEARLSGNLVYFEGHGWAHDWITNWKSTDDMVSWNVDVVNSCTYNVKLKYTCPPEMTGSEIMLSVPGDSVIATIARPFNYKAIPSPDRVKRKEAYECEWGILDMGNITLRKGNYPIKIKAMKIPHKNVMDFKSIILEKE